MGDQSRFKGQVAKKNAAQHHALVIKLLSTSVVSLLRVLEENTESAVLTQTSRAGMGVQFFRWIIARR